MSKGDHIELEGTIIHCGAGGVFKVEVAEGHLVTARLSGRMRKNRIKVVLGDQVTVNVSPYDPDRGFITFRKR